MSQHTCTCKHNAYIQVLHHMHTQPSIKNAPPPFAVSNIYTQVQHSSTTLHVVFQLMPTCMHTHNTVTTQHVCMHDKPQYNESYPVLHL